MSEFYRSWNIKQVSRGGVWMPFSVELTKQDRDEINNLLNTYTAKMYWTKKTFEIRKDLRVRAKTAEDAMLKIQQTITKWRLFGAEVRDFKIIWGD